VDVHTAAWFVKVLADIDRPKTDQELADAAAVLAVVPGERQLQLIEGR
jgi:hypothetical protein